MPFPEFTVPPEQPKPTPSSTPETDAAFTQARISWQGLDDTRWPWNAIEQGWEFAKELERQRDEARAQVAKLHEEQCVVCDGCAHGFPLRDMVESQGFALCPSCHRGEQP